MTEWRKGDRKNKKTKKRRGEEEEVKEEEEMGNEDVQRTGGARG